MTFIEVVSTHSGPREIKTCVKRVAAGSGLIKLRLERVVNNVRKLLAVFKIKGSIAPGRAELFEGEALENGGLVADEGDIVTDDQVADRVAAGESFRVEVDQVVHAHVAVAFFGVVSGEVLEFAVHFVIEVTNQEMRPELVEDIQVIRARAGGGLTSLVQSFQAELNIRLQCCVLRKVVLGQLLVFEPENGNLRTNGSRIGRSAIALRPVFV